MRHLTGRRLIGVLSAVAATLIAVQPAAAQVTSTSGSPGNYVVTDTYTSPGAHCFYPNASNANNDLYQIKVRPPKMFARDRTGGVDSQKVGWQFSIQHGTTVGSAPAGWTTYFKSQVFKASATDAHAAAFTTKTWSDQTHLNRWWRVKLLMFWYKPGSSTTISGQVNYVIDYYTISYPPNPDSVNTTDCIPGE